MFKNQKSEENSDSSPKKKNLRQRKIQTQRLRATEESSIETAAIELLDAEELPLLLEVAAEELHRIPMLHGRDDKDFLATIRESCSRPLSSCRKASAATTHEERASSLFFFFFLSLHLSPSYPVVVPLFLSLSSVLYL